MAERILVDCNNCQHLNITEEQQNKTNILFGIRPIHVCIRHNKRVFHKKPLSWHDPRLYPCVLCGDKDYTPITGEVDDMI